MGSMAGAGLVSGRSGERQAVNAIRRLLRDLLHLHIGQRGLHTWQRWRDRTWCSYCGKETR
jgi:hypothetical protein